MFQPNAYHEPHQPEHLFLKPVAALVSEPKAPPPYAMGDVAMVGEHSFAVADGMGAYLGSEVATTLACATIGHESQHWPLVSTEEDAKALLVGGITTSHRSVCTIRGYAND